MGCLDCGDPQALVHLGDAQLCDGCFNLRVGAVTGLPPLPAPPAPLRLTGPDGREHRLAFRFLRVPTGLEVLLEETGVPPCEGYRFAVMGDDEDVQSLVEHVSRTARREVGRLYLEPATHRSGWVLSDENEVAGRFLWNDESHDGRPFHVVVDGRTLTWEQLGDALDPYEGWNFRLVIEDRVEDARGDAEVIDIATTGRRPAGPQPAP